MKAFLLVCLAVAVKADPQLLLQQPLVGRPIISSPIISSALPVTSYIAGQPIVKLAEQKPVEEKPLEVETYSVEKPVEKKVEIPTVYTTAGVAGLPLATPFAYNTPIVQNLKVVPRYQAKNGEVEHIVYKREADAQVLLNNWASPLLYSNVAASPLVYNNWAVPAVPATGVSVADDRFKGNFAGKGLIRASAGAVHITKREADPQLLLNNWAAPIAPITYNAWAHPAVAPVAYNAFDGVNVAGQTVQNDLVKPQAYAGKGLIRVAPGGKSVHITKRDAEADPAILYRGLYNYAPSVVRPAVYSSVVRPAYSAYSSVLRPAYAGYSSYWL